MPVKRRLGKKAGLDHWKIDQFVHGWPMIAGVGYSAGIRDGCNHWCPEKWDQFYAAMRADWEIYGADFMRWWRGETEQFTPAYVQVGRHRDPSVTPWAMTAFGDLK
jgi:hypothetical protein